MSGKSTIPGGAGLFLLLAVIVAAVASTHNVRQLAANVSKPAPPWRFDSLYWEQLLTLFA